MPHIDTDLLQELHGNADCVVEALVVLYGSPTFEKDVLALMHEVALHVKHEPCQLVMFKNIHAFSIRATASFLLCLLNDARVHSATHNH